MNRQLKTQILQIIEGLPEKQLQSLLEYLQQLEKESNEQLELEQALLEKIFAEDAGLLKRLAQ